ncbi:MAG: 2-oxoglutarate dehydrogenase E1 component [Gemmatimonadota bacterium]
MDGYNAGYAELLYEQELREQGLIPPSLADWLGGSQGTAPTDAFRAPVSAAPSAAVAAEIAPAELADRLRSAAIAGALVEAYREQGHLAARIDPLGSPPPGHPSLKPEFYGISEADLAALPAAVVGRETMGETVLDVVNRLREIYCGSIGYELDHMENPAQRDWLVDYIESPRHRHPLEDADAIRLLERLSEVEGLERFLHRSYLGQKRFSIEGLDMLVPMLDETIRRAAAAGTREVMLGMAHRGRLNVLAHVIGRPYEAVVAEFEGALSRGLQTTVPERGSGDVKYHVGARETLDTPYGKVEVYLAPNPSHLEHINPVIEGMARAARECFFHELRGRAGQLSESGASWKAYRNSVLPILIHGDAAFIGQGIVAETLNLCRLEGYETGGTLHIIANNQLGFTTLPEESRSTRYASDLALGFRIPVFHVNADDPEACLAAIRLGVDYRIEFGEDIVIDLVGYRRHGHNEGDEPGYTQPLMYAKVGKHPSVREQWAERLVAAGVVSRERASQISERVAARLVEARGCATAGGECTLAGFVEPAPWARPRETLTEDRGEPAVETAVPLDRLKELNEGIHRWPEGFALFRKLGRQLEKRRESLAEGIDWAHAEALAFASLVTQGVRVRLTGEDTERATFSQRHLVLHDVERGTTYTPLEHLSPDQAPFEVYNSPLSEVSVLGFEYGYSTVASEALVLWEAQFGDFANVAQAIIDQFIVAGRTKWGQESRLVLLLPHGYEGQGPEHSSARLERFLQLAAQLNIRIANCTTPAQYFHLLRLQALRHARRPLVVLTPKSLLRHPLARSRVEELGTGRFHPILPDRESVERADRITRAILCSGKVYYDLVTSQAGREAEEMTVIRVERLYPLPIEELRSALAAYPSLRELVWVQEEPRNAGAWSSVELALRELAAGRTLRYVGRPERASPAEGYAAAHSREQERIVREAFA